jgi:hypothetical protein
MINWVAEAVAPKAVGGTDLDPTLPALAGQQVAGGLPDALAVRVASRSHSLRGLRFWRRAIAVLLGLRGRPRWRADPPPPARPSGRAIVSGGESACQRAPTMRWRRTRRRRRRRARARRAGAPPAPAGDWCLDLVVRGVRALDGLLKPGQHELCGMPSYADVRSERARDRLRRSESGDCESGGRASEREELVSTSTPSLCKLRDREGRRREDAPRPERARDGPPLGCLHLGRKRARGALLSARCTTRRGAAEISAFKSEAGLMVGADRCLLSAKLVSARVVFEAVLRGAPRLRFPRA